MNRASGRAHRFECYAQAIEQALIMKGVMAETQGFEPWRPLSGPAHLANECLQPLGHVSAATGVAPGCDPKPGQTRAGQVWYSLTLDGSTQLPPIAHI